MSKQALEAQLAELKSDYIRIQEDMEKLVFVGGRASSAEEQLVRLEGEIADVRKKLADFE
ncbi:MAG TPA: SE1832 family protein [Virgibacillus sp.]|nr:SE1832 family protein [Virgibacillus sp.]